MKMIIGEAREQSYAHNSKSQTTRLYHSMPTSAQVVLDFCRSNLPETITTADLGFLSAPNTLRLFPSKTLHFVHCSSSLHWLSQVPPELTDKANLFRLEEIGPNGRMVLTFQGRRTANATTDKSCLLWDYLGQTFQDLVAESLVKEERLDSFNIPFYKPYLEKLQAEVEKEGSFTIDPLELVSLPWGCVNGRTSHDRAVIAKQNKWRRLSELSMSR
ncbi:hypothetical protein DITRI_Ditri15bG0022000 [Diplodiscus trichospermus]